MEIKVNLKIFIFALIFYVTKQIELYALLMIFATIHELGHLLAGIFLGKKVKRIHIMPLGLSIEFAVDTKDYNRKIKQGNYLNIKKMIIAIAGPMVNLFIAFFFSFTHFQFFSVPTEYVIYANILIAFFNLLPIYPLDGGRILKEILHIQMGLKKSIVKTNTVSNITVILLTAIASLAIFYYKNIAILFIITYLWYLIILENKRYQSKMKIYQAVYDYEKQRKTLKEAVCK